MNIEFSFPDELRNIGNTSPTQSVVAELQQGVHETELEIIEAYQPQKMRDTYESSTEETSAGGAVELTTDAGVLYESFVLGSAPHFPYWGDPDIVEYAEARGLLPFQVALAVSKHGTPPHPEIEQILDRHEQAIADGGEAAVDTWLMDVLGA